MKASILDIEIKAVTTGWIYRNSYYTWNNPLYKNHQLLYKNQDSRKDAFRNWTKSLTFPSYLFGGVLIAVDKGTNAIGTVVFAIPGELGKVGNGPQSNEGAVDADVSEGPILRLSGTDGCFLCPPLPPRRLGGDGKALGLKLSSGRLVQSSIDANDDEVGDGGNNAGNAEG